ncbi:DUF4198 domain-containing protein [Deltaproteobacteria bacterium OttesenSCG-928-K17]|nr:DUF4198 domain-containing protein [Deltaproteobacteria bacterium OttesenSCG-928-K17]
MKLLSKACCLAVVMLFFGVSAAAAHEIWAIAENPGEGKPLVAILGYGHEFPHGEEIAPERLKIFYPLKVIDSKGNELALKPGDKNFKAVTEKPVEKGTYMIQTGYMPTFWSKGPDGSVMKPKNEVPGATTCERYSRSAKGIVNIGGASDDFVTKPIGTKLEIVPLVNPAQVKVGQDFPIQVLYDGKPLRNAQVKGTIEGNKYAEAGNRDFFGLTNRDGKLNMVPLKGGNWTLAVEIRDEFPDKAVCDDEAGDATLTFYIAE